MDTVPFSKKIKTYIQYLIRRVFLTQSLIFLGTTHRTQDDFLSNQYFAFPRHQFALPLCFSHPLNSGRVVEALGELAGVGRRGSGRRRKKRAFPLAGAAQKI